MPRRRREDERGASRVRARDAGAHPESAGAVGRTAGTALLRADSRSSLQHADGCSVKYRTLLIILFSVSVRAETLDALVKEALDHNPEVAAAGKAWEAAKARIPQARALDDPMVGVDVERTDTTRFDTFTDNEWMISQSVPWFGKRDAKGRVEAGMARSEERRVGKEG